jgi:hypothetical protein
MRAGQTFLWGKWGYVNPDVYGLSLTRASNIFLDNKNYIVLIATLPSYTAVQ